MSTVDGDGIVAGAGRHPPSAPKGVMHEARTRIEREHLCPGAAPKFERAADLAHLAERVLGIEDRDAAQEHVPGALTSLARGLPLADRTFPLARAELSEQLSAAGHGELGDVLPRSIWERPALSELREAVELERRIDGVALREQARRPGHAESSSGRNPL